MEGGYFHLSGLFSNRHFNVVDFFFFFRTMALELGPHNIRVNTVNPTVIMTEMGKIGWSDPNKARTMLSKIPLGRFGGRSFSSCVSRI